MFLHLPLFALSSNQVHPFIVYLYIRVSKWNKPKITLDKPHSSEMDLFMDERRDCNFRWDSLVCWQSTTLVQTNEQPTAWWSRNPHCVHPPSLHWLYTLSSESWNTQIDPQFCICTKFVSRKVITNWFQHILASYSVI